MDDKDKIVKGIDDVKNLGFDEYEAMPLYESQRKKASESSETVKKELKEEDLLYTKEIECPTCYEKFNFLEIKSNSYTVEKIDSDFLRYCTNINPLFYGVLICNNCGYSALKQYFPKMLPNQRKAVKEKISVKWAPRDYGSKYNVDIAIERYKLALINCVAKGARSGEIADVCLRLGWLYRLKEDPQKEKYYLEQAIYGFKEALQNERGSVVGIDDATLTYMIGELYRRIEDFQQASMFFSKIIADKSSKPSLKEKARCQRDVMKKDIEQKNASESKQSSSDANQKNDDKNDSDPNKKKFLFF
jgi:uncharacterized protein (DUF2225 family)